MHTFWSLSVGSFAAMLLLALLIPLVRISCSGRSTLRNRPIAATQTSVPHNPTENAWAQGVHFPVISWDTFQKLCTELGDLLVIDLRENAQHPLPVCDSVSILQVELYELVEILDLIPADEVVVFYGVSDFAMLLIETSPFVRRRGSAFVLNLDPSFQEVA